MNDTETKPWEAYQRQTVEAADTPPWEEYRRQRFGPTHRDLARLKSAFTDNPLDCIADPQVRADMFNQTMDLDNPLEAQQKIALAAYFSAMSRKPFEVCHENFDELVERYFGKGTSVEDAYEQAGRILRGEREQKNFWSRLGYATVANLGDIAETSLNFLSFVGKQFTAAALEEQRGNLELLSVISDDKTRKSIEQQKELLEKEPEAFEKSVQSFKKEHFTPIKEWAQEESQMPADWVFNSDGIGAWCENAAIAIISYLPNLAVQTGLTYATGGVTTLGVVYGINGYYNFKEQKPDGSEAEALFYGTMVGLINGGLEKVSFGIISGKVSRAIAKEGIKKGLFQAAKHFGIAAVLESGGEGLEEFAENVLDISMGLRGDTKDWNASRWRKELTRGVPEAMVTALATSPILEADAYRQGRRDFDYYRRRDTAEIAARKVVDQRIAEIEAKDNPTLEDQREIEELMIVRDAGSAEDVITASQKEYFRAIKQKIEEEEAGRDTTGAGGDVTEEAAADANNAGKKEKLKQELPHNPEETRQRVEEVKGLIRAELETTEEWTKDDLRQRIEQMRKLHPDMTEDQCFEFLKGQIPALWKDGKIIVNINNCRPSEVPFQIAHEALLHDGIRRAFGDEAANQLFDLVWNQFGESEGMRAILERYGFIRQKVDQNDNFVFDDEGKPVYEGYDQLTQKNKREAAEEFLAKLQETNGVPVSEIYQDNKLEIDDFAREHGMDPRDLRKENIDKMTREWMAATGWRPPRPSWLKQLISRIRTWFRQHGWFVNHISDDEILTILARAAKAEVSRRGGKSAQGGGVRYAIDEHGDYFPGPDEWGTAYTSMTGKGIDAVNFLLKKQEGWVPAAWHRVDIGDIDLVYGKTNGTNDTEDKGGWGVAHIDKKHNVDWIEVNDIILNGYIDSRSSQKIILKKHGALAIVKLQYQQYSRNWLVSAFGTNYPSAGISPAASSNKGATTHLAPRGTFNIGEVLDQVKLPDENSGEKSSGNGGNEGITRASIPPNYTGSGEVGQVGRVGQVEAKRLADDMDAALKQKFGSGNTSLRQVAAGFRKIEFRPGTVNLDLGGGKFDEATKFLAEKGVTNLVFDPVNRNAEHNRRIFEEVKNGGVDTVTCNNVLNVIAEPAARDNVILQAAKALKPDGTAYFTVYEGDGSGAGRQSQADAWQENRKTADYLEEVKKHFGDVTLKNKVIIARQPLTDGKSSAWFMDSSFENPTRYSVREFDPTAGNDRAKNVVAMLRPLVGRKRSGFDPAKLAAQVKERYGVDVTPAEVAVWLNEAIRQNAGEMARNTAKIRNEWLYNNNALWKLAVDYAGSENFKVRVSDRMKDRNLEGTFWLKKGDEKSAYTVINLDALANEVARQQGRDALDVEQEFFDFFNGLTKSGLNEQYNKYRREQSFADKEQERQAKEEWQQLEKNRIADEVVSIIEHGNPVTPEWAKANLKTYQELYRQLFGGEAPKTVAKRDVETLNAVLTGEISEADFERAKAKAEDAAARAKLADEYRAKAEKLRKDAAERIKANREADYKEFTKKLNELRDAMNQSKLDAEDVAKLQREAEAFAVANLDPAVRGEFTGRILKLKDFSTEPSALYPEGQRMHEFRKLVADMTGRANTARRDALVPRIAKLLDRYRVTRQYKGIPVSKAATVQAEIDEIGRIFRMSPQALEAYRGLQLDAMGEFEEGTPQWEEAMNKMVLSNLFGDLAHRDGNAAQDAMDYLGKVVTEGRIETRRRLDEKLEKLRNLRMQLVHNLTGGVVDTRGNDAKKFRDSTIKSRARLESLIQLASGLSVEEFDQSPFGDIVRRYNLAQDREMTKMRKLDGEVREAVARIFGKEYEGFFGFNKFLKELTTPVEHSGVFQTIYTAKIPGYSLVGKRPAIRAKLNWKIAEAALGDAGTGKLTYVKAPDSRAAREHLRVFAEKNGVKFDGDFGIFMQDGKLRVYTYDADAGLVNSFEAPLAALPRGCEYMALSDIARNYARHQIDDCSAGIRPVTSEFAEESADAQYQALNDAQKNAAEVELIADLPNLESSKEELANLTRDQALQLILTWEQEHYKDTMRWNGFDDATMQQLYDFVGEKHLEFARWMRDYESREADALDKLSREKYGMPLPRIENYHPGRFQGLAGQRISDGKQSPLGGMSMNPSFLIARRGHLKAPDLNVGAFGVFKDHIQNQTHFVELNDVVGDLRGVFNDLKVKAAINSTLGTNVTDEILRRIGSLATMSSQDRTAATKIFGRLYRHFVPAKLALSIPSMLKQGASALNYMEKIPMAAWGKYFTRSMSNHADFRKFRKWAWKSDYMQNRFAGGLDPDLVYLANHTLDSEHYDPLLGWMMDKAMIPTKLGDAFASIYGGYTVYAYTRDQALKNGATPLEAEKRARYAWMKATDETQQGSKLTSKNAFMQNPGATRFLTMFMTNPIQTMDLVCQSIDEVRLGRGGTEARKRLARQLVVSHLIIPTAMFAITQAWRRGFDLDEWDWDEWGLDCLLGSFNGFWYVNAAKLVLVKILKIVEGENFYRKGGERAVPVIDAAESAIDTTNRLVKKIRGDKELTARDYADGVRALGDAMIAGGQIDDRVGTAGAIFSAIGLRGGQILRWFEDKSKRGKR